jgi:hypothetical protein
MSLLTRLLTQLRPPDTIIAPHPYLKNARFAKISFSLFLIVILGTTVIMTLVAWVTAGEAVFPWTMLFVIFPWLCGISLIFVMEHWWKPLEALRLAAAQGDRSLLADEQPPNPEALSLDAPMKIVMRISKTPLAVFGTLFSLLLIIAGNINFLLAEWLQHLIASSTWIWSLSLTVFTGALMAFFFTAWWHQRWVVEVSDVGIRSWEHSLGITENATSLMFWHEARLFARYRRPGLWSSDTALIYELSSASQVILWTWVREQKPLRFGVAPTIPLEAYEAQMRVLRDLITAKTGLPLYDLHN